MGEQVTQDNPLQVQARKPELIIDPTHKEAGSGGVVPPHANRWKPGQSGNPGGKPKGADIRAAIRREFAKHPDADGIGKLCGEWAAELVDAAKAGDFAKVKSLCEVIHEIQGKPQERVEHTGAVANVQISGMSLPEDVPGP